MKSKNFNACVLITCCLSFPTHAQPKVIADFGGRETGIQTHESFYEAHGRELLPKAPAIPPQLQRFPLESELMPGPVETRKHNQKVLRPFFIIGYDRISLDWLIANADYFAEIKATGMVTNVDSNESMMRIKKLVPKIKIDAVPVELIAETFQLNNYPVLIDRTEIKQ